MRLFVFGLARSCAAAIAAVALLATAGSATADTWIVDKNTTVVHFSYDNIGLSRQSGRFKNIEGRLGFSPTDPERGSVEITMRAADISTGVPELDRLLRSPDFFDANRHPTIRFRSTGVKAIGEKTGEIDGELTMLGITWPVTLSAKWNFTGEYPLASINPAYGGKWVSGFSASTVIERSRWGMKRGIPYLSDQVEIRIEAEFVRAE